MEEDYFVKEEMIPDEFPSVMEEEEETESIIEDSKELIMDSEQNLTQQKAIIPFELCMIKEEQLSGTEDNEEHATKITSGESMPVGSITDANKTPICTRDEHFSKPAASTSASTSLQKYQHQRPKKKGLQSSSDQAALKNEVLLSVRNHFKRPANQDDRFDIFGKNVAMKLRDLPKVQRLLAEKIINEALFEAEIGTLTISHRLTCKDLRRMTPSPLPMRHLYLQKT